MKERNVGNIEDFALVKTKHHFSALTAELLDFSARFDVGNVTAKLLESFQVHS